MAPVLGFCPLPGVFWLAIVLIIAAYVASAELVKRMFYRLVGFDMETPSNHGN